MTGKITPTERAVTWRKEREALGYKQRSFLLSPEGLRALTALSKAKRLKARDVVEDLLVRAAKRSR